MDNGESYSERELSKLVRRKMLTKHHGDDTAYRRKPKHKRDYREDLDE